MKGAPDDLTCRRRLGLLERTRGLVGNAECCCLVMASLARLRAAMRSEDAALGACEVTTDDANRLSNVHFQGYSCTCF